eukprot:CAMPEP_0183294434 /NCGR_PEP_ID=MMETSP0160_2-20130417/2782_1 /TAXON_ID=2839 ORGANISM="Odontella Sinensis, Strain Grunow 1884" /NCGR_SAMPLE_ID=MMETSP0160_2 /ASSEMBLY_ACC=CAM_ASM_000250 /LENGTH=258 /DNA_ID=CAMNT_0025455765 /DNA_START=61 /DNA_END=840 /DNA_ORIENTATION=+
MVAAPAFLSTVIGRVLIGALAALASLRTGVGLYAWRAANVLESPAYSVVGRLPGGVELRRYESYLVAETTIPVGGFREGTAGGFRKCASYIFGQNVPRKGGGAAGGEKMAMTAPVRVAGRASAAAAAAPAGEKMAMTSPVRTAGSMAGETKVSFVIGSKYTLKSIPKPKDGSVSLREVPSHYLAARRFSGPPPKDDRVVKERERILNSLEESGMKPAKGREGEETMVYGYHDPFITPNILRRNEVAVMVDPKCVADTM